MSRTLVVGDVHGCADELDALVTRARPDHVVLVGDLFLKGPKPREVYDRIRSGGWTAVLGNHDQRLLDALAQKKRDRSAGVNGHIEALDSGGKGWRDWIRALPLFHEVSGWTVVHAGLHPSGEIAETTREMALVLRRWPLDAKNGPFWYDVYTGSRRVVFGHDAVRGLVRRERDGVPWLMGLDTGCVYGGALTGYVLETDELFQVPARAVYRKPG